MPNPVETRPPRTCYYTVFGESRSNSMGVCRGLNKFRECWARPIGREAWMIRRNMSLPNMCYLANLLVVDQTVSRV